MTLDECRRELSRAYNDWYASVARIELTRGTRVVSPMLQQVRLARSTVITLEMKLIELLNTTKETAA